MATRRMVRTRTRSFGRRGGSPRQRMWAREHDTGEAVGTQSWDLLSDFKTRAGGGLSSTLGVTVVRIRLAVALQLTGAVNIADTLGGIFGVIVDDSDTAAEVPSPFTERQANWMLFLPVFLDNVAQTSPGHYAFCHCNEEIDVRSSRKLESLESRLWLKFDPYIATGDQYDVRFVASTLLLLP